MAMAGEGGDGGWWSLSAGQGPWACVDRRTEARVTYPRPPRRPPPLPPAMAHQYTRLPQTDAASVVGSPLDNDDGPRPSSETTSSSSSSELRRRVASTGLRPSPPNPTVDFNPPPPAAWKRAALLVFIAALFYIALRLAQPRDAASGAQSHAAKLNEKLEARYGAPVVHAKRSVALPSLGPCLDLARIDGRVSSLAPSIHPRYSHEYKFRPASAPVIKERTKDGKVRLRGANPGGVY